MYLCPSKYSPKIKKKKQCPLTLSLMKNMCGIDFILPLQGMSCLLRVPRVASFGLNPGLIYLTPLGLKTRKRVCYLTPSELNPKHEARNPKQYRMSKIDEFAKKPNSSSFINQLLLLLKPGLTRIKLGIDASRQLYNDQGNIIFRGCVSLKIA